MMKDCKTCKDPTKTIQIKAGPGIFKKDKEQILCKNYDCRNFYEKRLYPGDVMPPKKPPETTEESEKPPKKAATAKATAKRKSPSKKDEK